MIEGYLGEEGGLTSRGVDVARRLVGAKCGINTRPCDVCAQRLPGTTVPGGNFCEVKGTPITQQIEVDALITAFRARPKVERQTTRRGWDW